MVEQQWRSMEGGAGVVEQGRWSRGSGAVMGEQGL